MYLNRLVLFIFCLSVITADAKNVIADPSGHLKGTPSAKNIYVSPKGNDKNPGTKEKPLATLQRAKILVAKIKSPVNVYLRAGNYYLKSPVIFNAKDSRNKNEAVTYMAYPGEKPRISSSVVLKLKWANYKGPIKQTKISGNFLFDQLFINGKQQRMARYPNYNPNVAHYYGYAKDALSPERIKQWKNPAGGYIHSLHKSEWGDFSYEITGKEADGKLKMVGGYQNNRPSEMHDNIRFVENIFEELDAEGEYYYNKETHILYFYPPKGTDPDRALIETPQLESLFEFRGDEHKPVSNIQLAGLEFGQTLRTFMKNKEPLLRSDWTIYRGGAITFEGATNCSVKNSFFNSVGGNAIVFTNFNRQNEVAGCRINKPGSSAIVFVGDPAAVRSPLFRYEEFNETEKIDRTPGPKTNNYPSECTVYNNLIEGIGQTEKQVAGVQISMAKDITVSHNTIDDVPRSGINVSEGTWGGHIIEFNDVFNTVLETGDHGSFNSWGRDRFWHPDRKKMDSIVAAHPDLILLDVVKPIIIRYNRFRCDHGWDVDLDDGSSNYRIYNNVFLNGGLKLREGFYRMVYNNIMVNNSFHPHVWFKKSGDVFKNNILMSGYFPIGMNGWGKEVDDNLFPDTTSLKNARKNGTDINSVFGNPMFVDALTGNYEVKQNSPALKVGFKNFPMNEFGVTSVALKAVANKVTLPVIVSGIKANSEETYDFLGAKVKNLNTLGERSATGMASETGVLVLEVPRASVLSGFALPNDVILEFNGKQINNMAELLKEKMGLQLRHSAILGVFRNQKMKKIEIALK